MELRWLTIQLNDAYMTRKPVLQYRQDPEDGWADVPTEVIPVDDYDEKKGLP